MLTGFAERRTIYSSIQKSKCGDSLYTNTITQSTVHNENLAEKTSVSETLQNQNLECILIISKGNNLNLGLFNSQTKIFAKTTEIFGDLTV